MRRHRQRFGNAYHPYQGRRRGGGWILLVVILLILLALAAWLWRDALLGFLPSFRGPAAP